MKACLICPSPRPAISALAQSVPLVNVPMFGKSLLEYWLEHLAGTGATHVQILADDRPEKVRELVGDGARWGLRAEVIAETRELSTSLARNKYPAAQKIEWLPESDDMVALTHFPGLPQHQLFGSYADWFAALWTWLPRAIGSNRLGMRELQPDVWVSTRARIAPGVILRAPCWIGEDVTVGPRCTIGPRTILENRALIGSDCEISGSVVGPETRLGGWAELKDSVAWDRTLINWKSGSIVTISDPLLLCALHELRPPSKFLALRHQVAAWFKDDKEELELTWDNHPVKMP
ncbi:MAG: Nucleotidyl transferase [Pedosphaera sp.]|nr:Nucleotidyl transferase [Pedosphaera sp.]